MAKGFYEVAAEIVQEVIKARGQAISGAGSTGAWQKDLSAIYLSDDAVVELYKKVLKTVEGSHNDHLV
jgi:hypothetical protein